MAEPIKISTSKYNKQGKIDIDGNIWGVQLPGAGTEMRFSQATRACKSAEARLKIIDKKIESGSVTEEELDTYDKYAAKYEENERIIYEIFMGVFRDDTENNDQVKEWINNTPTAILMLAFEDVKNTADNQQGTDGSTGTPESA